MEEVKEELKPCPFCGNMAEIKLDKKDSINAWNRRVNNGEIN